MTWKCHLSTIVDALMIPNKILKLADLQNFYKPCVYAWWRGDECLYVGATFSGMKRILHHNVIGSMESVKEGDEIRIYYVPDEEIYTLEMQLIIEHKPKYSSRPPSTFGKKEKRKCPACKNEFLQKRSWQIYCSKTCSQSGRNVPASQRF